MDPATLPVIVAIGELTDRPASPHDSLEPIELMAKAAAIAEDDVGGSWLSRVDSLDVVHQRSWRNEDSAGALCSRLRIAPARKAYGPYGGDSPVRFIHEAAARIAAGTSRVALIVSAESQYARNRSVKESWTPA